MQNEYGTNLCKFKPFYRSMKLNFKQNTKLVRYNKTIYILSQEQYMTIFIALNERFNAALETQSLSTFKDKVARVISYPQKQTCTEKEEFEVKKKKSKLFKFLTSIRCSTMF